MDVQFYKISYEYSLVPRPSVWCIYCTEGLGTRLEIHMVRGGGGGDEREGRQRERERRRGKDGREKKGRKEVGGGGGGEEREGEGMD